MTMAPAPMIAPFPTTIPGKMITRAPIQTSSSTRTGQGSLLPCNRIGTSRLSHRWFFPTMITSGPIITSLPTIKVEWHVAVDAQARIVANLDFPTRIKICASFDINVRSTRLKQMEHGHRSKCFR